MKAPIAQVPPPALLRGLLRSSSAAASARSLLEEPTWLQGEPPEEVLTALGDPEQAFDASVVDLALAWQIEALVPALMRAIDREGDVGRRRRLAWIAKQVPAVVAMPALLARARRQDEDRVVRRYSLETVVRLAFGGHVGWPDVEQTVHILARDAEPYLRESATALAGIGDDASAEKRALLIRMLSDPSAEVVAVAATALTWCAVTASDIEPALLARLLGDPNPLVRLSVEEMMAASGRAGG